MCCVVDMFTSFLILHSPKFAGAWIAFPILQVKELIFAHEGTDRSLVIYKDGRVRYVQIPADDPRVFDFMSTYGG